MKEFLALIEKYKKVNEEVDTELNKRKQITSELERAEASLAKAQSEENKELQKIKLATQEANREAKLQAKIASEQEGAITRLRAQLSLATLQYDKLSAAERNASKGKELEAKINTLNKEISNLEQNTGRFQRNVGNYPKTFEAFQQVGVESIKKVDNTFSNLYKNVLAGITAFLGFNSIWSWIKGGVEKFEKA